MSFAGIIPHREIYHEVEGLLNLISQVPPQQAKKNKQVKEVDLELHALLRKGSVWQCWRRVQLIELSRVQVTLTKVLPKLSKLRQIMFMNVVHALCDPPTCVLYRDDEMPVEGDDLQEYKFGLSVRHVPPRTATLHGELCCVVVNALSWVVLNDNSNEWPSRNTTGIIERDN